MRTAVLGWIGSLAAPLGPGDGASPMGSEDVQLVELRSDPHGSEPSRSFDHTVRAAGILFLSAWSDDVDPVLRLEGPGGKILVQNDDGGGGTAAFLKLRVRQGQTVRFTLTSKGAAGAVHLKIAEAPETEQTLEAAAWASRAVDEAEELWIADRAEEARARYREIVEHLIAVEGMERSEGVEAILDLAGKRALALRDVHSASQAWQARERHLARTGPPGHADLIEVRENLGRVLQTLGDPQGARALLEQALAARAATSSDPGPIQALRMDLANTLFDLGALAESRRLLEEVLESFSSTPGDERLEVQRARMSLGRTLRGLGELERARELLEGVVAACSRTLAEDSLDLQAARHNLAVTLLELGDLRRARALLDAALHVYGRTLPEDHPDLQSARIDLGWTLLQMGDLSRAGVLLERTEEVCSETLSSDHPTLLRARRGVAWVRVSEGEATRAREPLEGVLEVYVRTLPHDHPQLQEVRNELAATLITLGEYTRARALLQEVLGASDELPEVHPRLRSARLNLIYADLGISGDRSRARGGLERELALLSRTMTDDNSEIAILLDNLAFLSIGSGEPGRAREAVRRLARGLLDRLRGLTPLLALREVETIAERMRYHVSSVLSLAGGAGCADPLEDLEEEAFTLVESVRGIARSSFQLHQLVRRHGEEEAVDSLRRELERASTDLARLSRAGGSRETYLAAVDRREEAERRWNAYLRSLPGADVLAEPTPAVIAAVLAPEEAAVAYWHYARVELDPTRAGGPWEVTVRPSLLAFVIRRGEPLRRVELGPIEPIEDAVRDVLRWWKADDMRVESPAARKAAERLRGLILDPLRPALGEATRIVVALDDSLHLVPLDALPDGEGVVGDRVEIHTRSTLRELAFRREPALGSPFLLALGGIDYEREAEPLDRESQTPSQELASMGPAAPGAAPWISARPFKPLAATASEVRRIGEMHASRFEQGSASILTGRRASTQALVSLSPRTRFLHVATHGFFAPESIPSTHDERRDAARLGFGRLLTIRDVVGFSPMVLCGLALAGANLPADSSGASRGVMTAEELAALDLSGCELAVLSACDTNVGVRRAGQGVASLQLALHAAGARSVVTSLWKVSDEVTEELMVEFYRRIWLEREPKARALWEAKRALRGTRDSQGRPVHPVRDWAGWVLTGE